MACCCFGSWSICNQYIMCLRFVQKQDFLMQSTYWTENGGSMLLWLSRWMPKNATQFIYGDIHDLVSRGINLMLPNLLKWTLNLLCCDWLLILVTKWLFKIIFGWVCPTLFWPFYVGLEFEGRTWRVGCTLSRLAFGGEELVFVFPLFHFLLGGLPCMLFAPLVGFNKSVNLSRKNKKSSSFLVWLNTKFDFFFWCGWSI